MKGIRYTAVEEVETKSWMIQGTVYASAFDAKFAAAKLYSSLSNDGVVVKKVSSGYTCLYWRRK